MKEGEEFEHSYVVTNEVYTAFISAYGDKNPLHISDEFAQQKSFSEKVMHGAILAGFLSHFVGECLPDKNVIVQTYKLNFIKPVYLNDKLLLKAQISGLYESVRTVEFKYRFFKDNFAVAKGEIVISII